VWTTGQFQRPPRLTPAESLVLALGLRSLAGHGADDALEQRRRAFAARLEAAAIPAADGDSMLHVTCPRGAANHRAMLLDAARRTCRCRIRYARAGATAPDDREIEPYVLVADGDLWYTLARCVRNDDVRAFRIDRIESAEVLDVEFSVPDDFDPADHLRDGHVFRAGAAPTATVRYSPRIARWPVERGEAEPEPDGSAIARRTVADETWLARHVLQYGTDAELLDPPELRRRIREIAVAVSRLHTDGSADVGR
jgi:predicted DNA-binding transcriptional regulator YafY